MKHLKMSMYLLLTAAIFTGCEKETTTLPENSEFNNSNEIIKQSPVFGTKVEAIKNNKNEVTGYYFSDSPTVIYPINKEKEHLLYSIPNNQNIISLVGDEDNFGYGGSSNPDCVCFNLGNEIDLGIFDNACLRSDSQVENWTHDYTNNPNFQNGFVADRVIIEVREKFSDSDISIINIDGEDFNFAVNGYSTCGDPIVQSFTFTGEDAAFANDGIINITFVENGDTIALDWAKVTITGSYNISDLDNDGVLNENDAHPNSDMSEYINIGGFYPNVKNKLVRNGSTMMDQITDLINEINAEYNGSNYEYLHRKFLMLLERKATDWRRNRLITNRERDAISRSGASASIPYTDE